MRGEVRVELRVENKVGRGTGERATEMGARRADAPACPKGGWPASVGG